MLCDPVRWTSDADTRERSDGGIGSSGAVLTGGRSLSSTCGRELQTPRWLEEEEEDEVDDEEEEEEDDDEEEEEEELEELEELEEEGMKKNDVDPVRDVPRSAVPKATRDCGGGGCVGVSRMSAGGVGRRGRLFCET